MTEGVEGEGGLGVVLTRGVGWFRIQLGERAAAEQ